MDPLGVAEAVLALAVYPGGILLLLLGRGASRVAGFAGRWTPSAREIAVLVLLDAAVASAPLPGSPVASLPPSAGAAPDLAVTVVLLASAAALAAPERWRPGPVLAGLLAIAALGVVAVGAASLSLPAIAADPRTAMQAARAAAAAAILAAGPVVAAARGLSPPGRATLVTGLAVTGLALTAPPASGAGAGAISAASIAVTAAAYAAAITRWSRAVARLQPQLTVVTGLCCAAAVAAVTLGTRG